MLRFGSVPAGLSPLEQRVRRLAVLATTSAALAAVLGDSWALVGWAGMLAMSGALVYAWPNGVSGALWLITSIGVCFVGAIAWVQENVPRNDRDMLPLPGSATIMFLGVTTVLVFVALPLVLLFSSRARPSDSPRARVSR
jgi:hypothetical protein